MADEKETKKESSVEGDVPSAPVTKKKQALSGRVSFTPSLSPRNAGGSLKLEF